MEGVEHLLLSSEYPCPTFLATVIDFHLVITSSTTKYDIVFL